MGRRSTGTVERVSATTWRARVTIAGVKHSENLDTEAAARGWLAELLGDPTAPSDWRDGGARGQTLLSVYALRLFSERRDEGRYTVRTAALYTRLLDLHIVPGLGHHTLIGLSPEHIDAWYAGMTCARTERGQAYGLLAMIMNAAVKARRIPSSPCLEEGRRNKVTKKHVVIASAAVVEALAAAVPARYRLLVLLGAWSGLRYSELTNLRREDVAFDPLRITARVPIHFVAGAWREGTRFKSEAGERTVHLPPSLEAEVRAHLDAYVGGDKLARLIATGNGTPPHNGNWCQSWKRACRTVGRPDLDFHDLRHTMATVSAQAGATTAELMSRMGHGSEEAAGLYQHADAVRDAALAIELDKVRRPAAEVTAATP